MKKLRFGKITVSVKPNFFIKNKGESNNPSMQKISMADGSVNVESRTSSQDKRWTIMAALLGTNTAVMLFQGIEQGENPKFLREIALAIIAAALPFQAIYFLIYTFLLENDGKLTDDMTDRLNKASAVCQLIAYLSLIGVGMMWYDLSPYVGTFFVASTLIAIIFIRLAMKPVNEQIVSKQSDD